MSAAALLHTREAFALLANAPIETAWPLFGADGERAWAPGWEPAFLWPQPAVDRPGMVFTIRHREGQAVWVNTAFDPAARRIQYVYVIPEVVATVITLTLTPAGHATGVEVVYERTALAEAANATVTAMAADDRAAAAEWSRQINGYLAR